ncbi:hypothetical protein BMS3Bbin02_01575 [bacterium BMS3Bbin02]|nr:hypothetical protein BMS3Bbin02_01575 [bacterium BMS3Bbin02]
MGHRSRCNRNVATATNDAADEDAVAHERHYKQPIVLAPLEVLRGGRGSNGETFELCQRSKHIVGRDNLCRLAAGLAPDGRHRRVAGYRNNALHNVEAETLACEPR